MILLQNDWRKNLDLKCPCLEDKQQKQNVLKAREQIDDIIFDFQSILSQRHLNL